MNRVIQKAELSAESCFVCHQWNRIMAQKGNRIRKGIVSSVIFLLVIYCSSVCAAEGFQYGRFLVKPKISVGEEFNDNVFGESESEKSDNMTFVSPALSNYLAITDSSRLGAHYRGNFSFYSKYDSLNEKDNKGTLDWSLKMPAGSTFFVDASLLDTQVQPDYDGDRANPYSMKNISADANLKPGEFTDIGFRYQYNSKEFDETRDAEDDYDRNLFVADYVNRYFPRFPFLLEYRYMINDRSDLVGSDKDSTASAVFIGARWTPETRLSGNLRVGYQNTDYEGIPDVDSFVVDTALSYRLTDITTLYFVVKRSLKDSETVENETGNNYTFTTWEGGIRYRYSDPLQLSLRLRYEDKEYDESVVRQDDIFNTRFGVNYQLNRWIEFSINYEYTQRDSTVESEEYRSNKGYIGAKFSL